MLTFSHWDYSITLSFRFHVLSKHGTYLSGVTQFCQTSGRQNSNQTTETYLQRVVH